MNNRYNDKKKPSGAGGEFRGSGKRDGAARRNSPARRRGGAPDFQHKHAPSAFADLPEDAEFGLSERTERSARMDYAVREDSAGETENPARDPAADETNGAVVGRNAVRELLRSGRDVDKIFVRRGEREGSITMLVAMALERKIPVMEVEKPKLDLLACGLPHQGIAAMAAQKEYCTVEDLLHIAEERGEMPLLVIADNINDPNNLGALIRCAEGAGAHGVILPKRHAAGVSPAVTRASAGAVEHMAIAKVPNLAQCIADLKKRGIWVYAAEAGGTAYYEADYHNPCALVFGSEGEGVSRLIRESCDFVVSIPMYGQVNSLNVSTAAAVIINEAKRGQVLGGTRGRQG